MRNWTAFVIGVGILVAASYGAPKPVPDPKPADPKSEKQAKIDQAKRDLANAEAQLRTAERRADRTQNDLENAIRDRERVGQLLTTTNQDEGELTRVVVTHEREAKDQQSARDRVKTQSDDAAKAVSESKKTAADASKAVESAKKDAEKEYLETTESRERLAKIDELTAALATERQRVLAALSDVASYKQLKQNAAVTEAAVKAARDDARIDPATLGKSSQAWIDAKSKVESAERDACKADPAYVTADDVLTQSKAAHQEQVNAFRLQLPTHPTVAPALATLAEAQRMQESTTTQQTTALAELKLADAAFQAAAKRYNETTARLQQTRIARDKLATQLTAADRNVSAQERDLADAKDDLRDARRALDDARRRLRDAERA